MAHFWNVYFKLFSACLSKTSKIIEGMQMMSQHAKRCRFMSMLSYGICYSNVLTNTNTFHSSTQLDTPVAPICCYAVACDVICMPSIDEWTCKSIFFLPITQQSVTKWSKNNLKSAKLHFSFCHSISKSSFNMRKTNCLHQNRRTFVAGGQADK